MVIKPDRLSHTSFGISKVFEARIEPILEFQDPIDAFSDRIIVAVSSGSHAASDALFVEIVAISAARILHTAVAVMNHTLARLGHSAGAPRSQPAFPLRPGSG